MKLTINKKMKEFNKPSELTQVIFLSGPSSSYILQPITPSQLDIINALFYSTKENIIKNKIIIPEDGSTVFEYPFKQLATMISKYESGRYDVLLDDLKHLRSTTIVINSLGKNKDIEELTYTSFIQEVKISKHKNTKLKNIKLTLSNTVINTFISVKKCFSKMFFEIQFSLVSKYSKLLYELLKDYEGIKNITLEKEDLILLLNVTKKSQKQWMYLNNNILKKIVTEINEKSDIHVSYEPIKEKLEGQRLQVTKIKFNIKKQPEERLQELGLIEEPITSLPFYNKSKTKLDKLVKNGYKVIDEDMWIQTDIKKNEERYDAEVRLDKWLKETDQNDRNEIYRILAANLDNCEDPMVVVEDYRIIGLFTKEAFTKTAQETMNKLNQIINEYKEEL